MSPKKSSTAPNYSAVSASTSRDPGQSPPDAAPSASVMKGVLVGNRPVLIGAAVLLVIILVILGVAAACGSSGDEDSAAAPTSAGIGSAHGPASIVSGIPSKYTHDKPGAATAAINFAQSVDQARDGKVSGAKLTEIAVGPAPSEALTKVLEVASGRAEDRSVFNSAPAMVTVPNYTDDKATVAVWSVGASQAPVNDEGKVGVLTLWTTTTVTLQWSDNDWKAIDWQFQSGPNPDEATFPEADAALSKTAMSGYYSFFVN